MAGRNSKQSHRDIKAIHQSLGHRISQLHKKKRLSQEQFAVTRIASIERCEAQVTFLTLVAMAGQIGITVHKLLNGIA